MNDDYKVLPIIINPARIIQAIIESGWSEDEACMESHVNHDSLRKLKAGRMPRPDVLRRLCETLNVPVNEVVYSGSLSPGNTDPDLVNKMAQKRKLLEAIRQAEEDIHSGEDSLTAAKRLSSAISHLEDTRPTKRGRWDVFRGGWDSSVRHKDEECKAGKRKARAVHRPSIQSGQDIATS